MLDSSDQTLKEHELGLVANFELFDQVMKKTDLTARYFLDTIPERKTDRRIE